MIATRCIRCTRVLEGGGQYCDDCRPAPVEPPPPAASAPSMPACPTCGRPLDSGTPFCPYCQHQSRPQVQYGGFWIRLAAYLIDALILGVFSGLASIATNSPQNAFLLNLVAGAVYYVGFWVAEGATPGKMVFGLKVRSVDGSPIDFGQGVLRLLGYWVSGLILGIGFLVMLFNEERRGLPDYMANTVVVIER